MKALIAMLILVSSIANADCDLIEDPVISEVNCNLESVYLPSGSEWTRLYYNPASIGLKNAGVMNALVTVVMNGNDALVGKVEASAPLLDHGSVRAGNDSSAWIDVVLHRNSAGASSIELLAYRYVAGKLGTENSASTPTLSAGATTAFSIDYSYAIDGTVTTNIRALGTRQVLASLSVAQFGQVLPSMKLRRGLQPVGSGVSSASFSKSMSL